MQSSLTSEQILSLAADKYTIRTTRTWSTREKWLRTGQDQNAIWGEFKGKSKAPIQTMVSSNRPIFSCTCSSRKLPCSHALGLRILYLESPHLFPNSHPTSSGTDDWIASLADDGTIFSYVNEPAQSTVDTQQEQQDDTRLRRIRRGLDELDLWLGDVVRNGLESVRDKKRTADWQRMARRLVDAQASELAVSVRKLATIPGSTPNWPEELLAKMGTLHLLIQGFRNFENLTPEVQGDLRLAVGWLPRVVPTSQTVIRDRWQVVARQQEMVGKQRRHKLWLWGEKSNRPALIIQMLRHKQKQVESIAPGVALVGNLYFYPSMSPLRAELVNVPSDNTYGTDSLSPHKNDLDVSRPTLIEQPQKPAQGYTDLDEAFRAVNHAFAQNPWLTEFPIMVRSAHVEQVTKAGENAYDAQVASIGALFKTGNLTKPLSWYLTDRSGMRLPLPEKFDYGWHLTAMETGESAHVTADAKGGPLLFGIWNRVVFTPTTVWQGGRWLSLHILKGEG